MFFCTQQNDIVTTINITSASFVFLINANVGKNLWCSLPSFEMSHLMLQLSQFYPALPFHRKTPQRL